jgi:hypothetical protein
MTTIRVQRSDDPTYLCAHEGPSLDNNVETDEAIVTVHTSEMTAEIAATLSEESTRVSNAHHIRRAAGDVSDTPSYEVKTICCPRSQIPDGQAVHIEQRGRELMQMYDETHITPELATRLAAITQQAGRYYDLKT